MQRNSDSKKEDSNINGSQYKLKRVNKPFLCQREGCHVVLQQQPVHFQRVEVFFQAASEHQDCHPVSTVVHSTLQ